jgi:hypothetical protein
VLDGRENLVRIARGGDLVNFRDIVLKNKDLHLRRPENKSLGWYFVFEEAFCTICDLSGKATAEELLRIMKE